MSDGDPPDARGNGFDQRFTAMYDELRRLAGRCIVRDLDTLHPTALVHEAYLRCRKTLADPDDGHLRALLVTAMRHILVDHARRRRAEKRGGDALATHCELAELAARPLDLVEFEDALTSLQGANARMARIVELRVLGGFTIEEVAHELSISTTTVSREWTFARAWLSRRLLPGGGGTEKEEVDG
ncbi:MAG: sigma-70 family RNA polymerase sigma factor [Planctomycetes bacterium]|nr:sigma-70 family RNA polymerase sigma factor [Planctomycetota bacterium]